jgi:uncharacterized membrane protein YeiH
MTPARDRLLTMVDLASVFLFAIEGALAAVRADLDLLGVLVLAFVGSVGGGIIRDVILGETPPAAFRNWHYPAIALAATLVVIAAALLYGAIGGWSPPLAVAVLDAAALALASIAGARKAMDYGANGASVVMLGALTGCGGGTLRDVLLANVPRVLRADFYATAAIAGALLLVVLVRRFGVKPTPAALVAGLLVFGLRGAAVLGNWSLPHLR